MEHKFTDCEVLHADVVDKVRPHMPKDPLLHGLSNIFKIMGDTTRLRILWALDQNEMCVCDLAVLLNMTKSAISHQLRLLRDANLVRFHREGKNVFYSLDDNHVKDIFEKAVEHIIEKS